MQTTTSKEHFPNKEKLRQKYRTTLEGLLVERCINKSAFARSIGVSRQALYLILWGDSYPTLALHARINEKLGVDLPYTPKYKGV